MTIAQMNWQDVERAVALDDRCVLPIGSTEQHSKLSLCVDSILAEQDIECCFYLFVNSSQIFFAKTLGCFLGWLLVYTLCADARNNHGQRPLPYVSTEQYQV